MKTKYELWESEEIYFTADPDFCESIKEQVNQIVESKQQRTQCGFEQHLLATFETLEEAKEELKNHQQKWNGFENKESVYITLFDICKVVYDEKGEIDDMECIIVDEPSIY